MSTNQKNFPESRQLIFPLFDDSIKKCKCGCGLPVKWEETNKKWRTYLQHHCWNDPEYVSIRSKQMLAIWSRPEFKEKMELLNIERWEDPEFRQMHIDKAKKQWEDSEFVSKIQQGLKEKWTDPDYRKQMSAVSSKHIKALWANPEYKDKKSKLSKLQWENPEYRNMMTKMFSDTNKKVWQNPEYRARQIATMKITNQRPELKEIRRINAIRMNQKMWQNPEYRNMMGKKSKERWTDPKYLTKWFASINRKPNKPESLLLTLTSENVEYIGDGKWWRTLKLETANGIVIKHKNPDFKVKGQKKIIEFNGTYWHRNDYPDEVYQMAWTRIGYKVMIIWEDEVKNNVQNVIERINQFTLEN